MIEHCENCYQVLDNDGLCIICNADEIYRIKDKRDYIIKCKLELINMICKIDNDDDINGFIANYNEIVDILNEMVPKS